MAVALPAISKNIIHVKIRIMEMVLQFVKTCAEMEYSNLNSKSNVIQDLWWVQNMDASSLVP